MSRESKLLSLVLLIVMLCTCCLPAFAEEGESIPAAGANVPEGYKLVAENSRFNLYLQESDMAVVIERKDTGDVMFSTVQSAKKGSGQWAGMQYSGVVIEFLRNVEDKPVQADFVNNEYTIDYTYGENSFDAHVTFVKEGISFTVTVWMDEAGMHAHMDESSIVETRDDTYLIHKNKHGKEERLPLKKYTKTDTANEYVLVTKDGTSYVLNSNNFVSAKDDTVTLSVAEGVQKTVPLAEDKYEYLLKTKDGTALKIPPELIAAVDSDERAYLLNSMLLVSSDKNGKGGTTYIPVKLTDGSYVPLDSVASLTLDPLTVPVKAYDAQGNATVDTTISAYDVAQVVKNVYVTGTAEDGSAVRVLQDNVVEISDISYTISSVYLYPFMGYSEAGVGQGYMIIPDGQGAIIGFEDNEKRYSTPYDKQVYGVNIGVDVQYYSQDRVAAEDVLAPFFGMVHTDKGIGVLSVIGEGDTAARIIAYPNGVRNLQYDWVTAKYVYRFVLQQPMGPGSLTVATRNEHRRDFNITQHFLLECGDSASYAGLAVAYRNYLISEGTFDKAAKRPFDVQLDFIGLERENFILGKQDVVMTSFDQAAEILNELMVEGIEVGEDEETRTLKAENLSAVLRGWQSNGLTGGLPTDSFSPAGSLGGKNGLKSLQAKAEELGVDLSLETDFLNLNIETHPTMTFSAFKRVTSQTWSRSTFGKVYQTMHYLTPMSTRDIGLNMVDALSREGFGSVTFTGITQLLSDYYHQDKYHDTTEMAALYSQIISKANESMTSNLVSPNAYLWKHAGVISDLPVGGSDYTYTDAEIPFLTIALSGQIPYYVEYVNFQANTKELFLHLVEQGARPSFLLTMEDPIKLQNSNSSNIYSSRYDLYKEMIVEWYSELNALYETVGADGMIVDHVRSGDMVCVTWSNGTKVYLNFGDVEATMDGVTLAKMDYEVVNGNGN